MKNDRQSIILEIISDENIETQEQLLERLQARGITSTQATISRDIKQMHLIKEPVGQGIYKYAVSGNRTKLNFAEKLRTIFRQSITSIDCAQNLVVVKTMPATVLTAAQFEDGKISAINLLEACGLCASNGEARRLIQQGGVAVNDQKVGSIDEAFSLEAFSGEGLIIKKGKKIFHRATLQ